MPHGGVGALPLTEIAARYGIDAPPFDAAAVESAWGFGNIAWLRDQVAAEVIAVWRLWLAQSPPAAEAAGAAFDA